jgi:YVTN family beta-propeller protein
MVSEDFPAEADDEPAGFAAVSRLADYHLEERIGAGGMAVVFRARDERLQRRVALKVLAPALARDKAFRHRFIRESRAAAAVDDPHIIPVFEAGEAEGVLFLAMRYVPGGDVRTLVRRAGQLSPAQALAIISPVASALDAAHSAGLVHRDVKLANILLDVRPGRPDHVYLSDFGLSKMVMSSLGPTQTGQFLGTPGYSAPEQLEGKQVDGRADQYSLACATFELLCGQTPFPRDQLAAVIWAHLSEPPPMLTSERLDLPPAIDSVLAKALAKAPTDRYATCREFADALRAALGLPPYHSKAEGIVRADRPQDDAAWPPGTGAGQDSILDAPVGAEVTDGPEASMTMSARHASTTYSPETEHQPRHGRGGKYNSTASDVSRIHPGPATWADGRGEPPPAPAQTGGDRQSRSQPSQEQEPRRTDRRRRTRRIGGILAAASVVTIAGFLIGTRTGTTPQPKTGLTPSHSDHSIPVSTIPHGPTAYVIAGDAIDPINLTTNTASKPIAIGGDGNASGIAVTRSGKTAFATVGDSIIPINLATGRPGTPMEIGYPLSSIAITPDGETAYVADDMGVGTVIRVNLATGRYSKPIKVDHPLKLPDGHTVGDGPIAIAITPDGKTAYTANYEAWTVTPIDVATGARGTPIRVGQNPNSIAITPDGKTAYTANAGDGTVTPIDLATHIARAPIDVPGAPPNGVPWAIAITPNGKTAYVATVAGKLISIDLATGTPGKLIRGDGSYPLIAIAPNGKVAYVTSQFGQTIMPIDLTNGLRGAPIRVGQDPPQEIVIVG